MSAKTKPAAKATAPTTNAAAPAAETAAKPATEKVSKPAAKKSDAPAKAAPAAKAEVPALSDVVNGVSLSYGNIKGGGTAKAPLIGSLPIKSISVQKGFNPRVQFVGIDSLADSIKKDGLLSSLTVRPGAKEGEFLIVAGERRFRALQLLGVTEVPCLIRTDLKDDDLAAKAAAVAENSEDGRTSLNAIELGRVFTDLEKQGWTIQKIASQCNVEVMKVRRCISLQAAPVEVQKKVEAGTMAVAPALELAKLDDKTRAAIQAQLSSDPEKPDSANDIKKMAKAAALGTAEGAESAADGKSAKTKKGAARAASLTTWKSSKEKQTSLAELCHIVTNAAENEKTGQDYFEIRGAIAALLWDRGDISDITLPDSGSTDAKRIKAIKLFDTVVLKESEKHAKVLAAANA